MQIFKIIDMIKIFPKEEINTIKILI